MFMFAYMMPVLFLHGVPRAQDSTPAAVRVQDVCQSQGLAGFSMAAALSFRSIHSLHPAQQDGLSCTMSNLLIQSVKA